MYSTLAFFFIKAKKKYYGSPPWQSTAFFQFLQQKQKKAKNNNNKKYSFVTCITLQVSMTSRTDEERNEKPKFQNRKL